MKKILLLLPLIALLFSCNVNNEKEHVDEIARCGDLYFNASNSYIEFVKNYSNNRIAILNEAAVNRGLTQDKVAQFYMDEYMPNNGKYKGGLEMQQQANELYKTLKQKGACPKELTDIQDNCFGIYAQLNGLELNPKESIDNITKYGIQIAGNYVVFTEFVGHLRESK